MLAIALFAACHRACDLYGEPCTTPGKYECNCDDILMYCGGDRVWDQMNNFYCDCVDQSGNIDDFHECTETTSEH